MRAGALPPRRRTPPWCDRYGARRDQSPVTSRFKSRSSIGNDAVDVPDLADADSRTTISRASWVAPVTGPPANTDSPAESALAEAREPSSRTTDALVSTHVHVVLSAARTVTSLPATDTIVPRSNARVRVPCLVRNVNSPCSPPSRRRWRRARRTRRNWATCCAGVLEGAAMSVMAELSAAASAGWPASVLVAAPAAPLADWAEDAAPGC
jgi:hypothetical protein